MERRVRQKKGVADGAAWPCAGRVETPCGPLEAHPSLESCRLAYKACAQTCAYPMDPSHEACGEGFTQGARERVMVGNV